MCVCVCVCVYVSVLFVVFAAPFALGLEWADGNPELEDKLGL